MKEDFAVEMKLPRLVYLQQTINRTAFQIPDNGNEYAQMFDAWSILFKSVNVVLNLKGKCPDGNNKKAMSVVSYQHGVDFVQRFVFYTDIQCDHIKFG